MQGTKIGILKMKKFKIVVYGVDPVYHEKITKDFKSIDRSIDLEFYRVYLPKPYVKISSRDSNTLKERVFLSRIPSPWKERFKKVSWSSVLQNTFA